MLKPEEELLCSGGEGDVPRIGPAMDCETMGNLDQR
jgi:hypothetical protein